MALLTVEGIVENGQIRLCEPIILPEHAKVYVVVPDAAPVSHAHIASPHLAHPAQAADFIKQVIEVVPDAAL